MYIDVSTRKAKGKKYKRILIRDSYRENGKVKHHTYGNLSNCKEEIVNAIKLALKYEDKLHKIILNDKNDTTHRQGKSCGALYLLQKIAADIGIIKALGNTRQGKLALWQIFARIIDQGSRLSAVRLAQHHGACDIMGLDNFTEDDLYENLKWLNAKQTRIENRLFKELSQAKNSTKSIYLYDVTSSYFEGVKNELGAFGYNRDKKRGKKQIVIGLLTDESGIPLSIQVFKGNTNDTKTFGNQIKKVTTRFHNENVVFVGDRGMIKGPQIEELSEQPNYYYITAISKSQIETLLKQKVLQLDLFDETVREITTDESIRYILRRNNSRAQEIEKSRQSKLCYLESVIAAKNEYFDKHPRSDKEKALKKIKEKAEKLKINSWANLSIVNGYIALKIDDEKKQEEGKLDGCYVIKTDINKEMVDLHIIHNRYKDLSKVERNFRMSKTGHLEMRPINVRKEEQTRGHAFVVMLALRLGLEIEKYWNGIECTVEEGIKELSSLCFLEVIKDNKVVYNYIPEPRASVKKLLDATNTRLPKLTPWSGINVATRKKLSNQRNSH